MYPERTEKPVPKKVIQKAKPVEVPKAGIKLPPPPRKIIAIEEPTKAAGPLKTYDMNPQAREVHRNNYESMLLGLPEEVKSNKKSTERVVSIRLG